MPQNSADTDVFKEVTVTVLKEVAENRCADAKCGAGVIISCLIPAKCFPVASRVST